jgi:hypothetical protein
MFHLPTAFHDADEDRSSIHAARQVCHPRPLTGHTRFEFCCNHVHFTKMTEEKELQELDVGRMRSRMVKH